MKPPAEIETARLKLRPSKLEDADAVFQQYRCSDERGKGPAYFMTRLMKASAGLILLLMLTSCAPMSQLSLRSTVPNHGVEIGAAVMADPLLNDELYGWTLAREFSIVTPENAMKFDAVHPSRDRRDFSRADTIVEFAESNGMKVRGHTLVWHEQVPLWVTEGNWTRDELIGILREHITTLVGRYRGRVAIWDVLSEAIDDNGLLRDTIWSRGIGREYIDMTFQWAHEADPDALLFYNDYGGEGLGTKSDAIFDMVRELLQRGVPIHGVGLQMHVALNYWPKPRQVAANMRRLAELGLQVHITEIDVGIDKPLTRKKLRTQALVYRDMLDVCLSAENCGAFELWGFTDRYSWVPIFFPGWDDALIFDRQYRPKPAYDMMLKLLAGRRILPAFTWGIGGKSAKSRWLGD